MVEPHSPAASVDAVYFDGAIRRADEARFAADDHGVLFGFGFFESFRTSGGRPHLLARHWGRLDAACARAGLALPGHFLARDRGRLVDVLRELLARHARPEAVFRYTVTAGAPSPDQTYAQPVELLTLRPLPPAPRPEGVALRVLALARDSGEWSPRPKSLNYANALLGAQELRRRGVRPDDEGLFLDRDGFVVETPRQALAWVRDGKLCFPDASVGALASTGLAWACEQVPASAAVRATVDDLLRAEAVMAVNAVRGVTPVRELWNAGDDVRLGTFASSAHPLVAGLMRCWSDALQATARGEA